MKKSFLSIPLFFFLYNSLFSMGFQNKKSLKEIKKILIQDKNTRIIAILPFENKTLNDDYSYLGKTIQMFLYNKLSHLSEIQISTNDIYIPEKYKTNKNIIFDYGTNFTRYPIFLQPESINKIYYKIYYPDNKKIVSENLKSDYLIYGDYNFFNKKNEEFKINFYIYNLVKNSNYFISSVLSSKKKLENELEKISISISKFFNPQKIGYLKIVAQFSNFDVFIDNKLKETELDFSVIPAGEHILKIRLKENIELSKKINIEPEKTNIIYFTNKNFTNQKVILKIDSNPTNVSVFIDIKYAGNTPIIITNVEAKIYRIKLEKENFNTIFTQVKLNYGTNYLFLNLKKSLRPNPKKEKTIMWTTLGLGIFSLLSSYYFYSEADIAYDKYIYSREKKQYDIYARNAVASYTFLAVGLGSLSISFIYYLKTIKYDEVEVGLKNANIFLASKNLILLFYKRF